LVAVSNELFHFLKTEIELSLVWLNQCADPYKFLCGCKFMSNSGILNLYKLKIDKYEYAEIVYKQVVLYL